MLYHLGEHGEREGLV